MSAEKKAKGLTKYVVLQESGPPPVAPNGRAWEEVARVDARSAREARKIVWAGLVEESKRENLDLPLGRDIVAVPLSSWQPKPASAELRLFVG